MVLVGDPGSGKSSLAQSLLLEWAYSPTRPLPILIELRSYTQDIGNTKSFLKYLEEGEGSVWHFSQRDLDGWLRTHDTLVIFDGLDEVFDPVRRHETTRAILRFATEYSAARVLVTSRLVGYRPQELRNGGFRHFTLQEFSDKQVQHFLNLWHDEAITIAADRASLKTRLKESIFGSRPLRELARNPLLLTMLAMLNRNQELPRDRADAYDQMSRVLLHQWDVNKFLREHGGGLGKRIGRQEKEEILRRIAGEIQTNSKVWTSNLISNERLESLVSEYLRNVLRVHQPDLGARLIIQQLRERNFILCQASAEYFAFVHRTFLEYFCASALVRRFFSTLSLKELHETFRSRSRDESWREILTLIAAMLPEAHATTLIEALLAQKRKRGSDRDFENVFLGADCWREIPEHARSDVLRRKLWYHLTAVADFKPGVAYPLDDIGTVIPHRESELLRTLTVRTRAVASIGAAFAGTSVALHWLEGCLEHKKTWAVRQAAIRALAKGWPRVPEAGRLIRSAGRLEEDENVRVTAVLEAARGWGSEPGTLEWLKELAESDLVPRVRKAAAQELAQNWSGNAEVLEFLDSLRETS